MISKTIMYKLNSSSKMQFGQFLAERHAQLKETETFWQHRLKIF